ncbi:MAG: sulfatase [Halobacteriaceae archaeon]
MPDRPNVLVVFTDQHRADALGCAGHPVVETPNLDRLAGSGVRFDRAYTPAPVCVPARASLYMGAYPHNTQVRDFDSWVPESATTFVDRLREEGYYTAHVGEVHQKGLLETKSGRGDDVREYEDHAESLGFDYVHETTGVWSSRNVDSPVTDYWEERGVLEAAQADLNERYEIASEYDLWEEGGFSVNWPSPLDPADHLDGYVCRRAMEFVENYDRDQPFALWVGIPGPHEPMDPPEEFAELYDPADVPEPTSPGEPGEWVPDDVAEFVEDDVGKRPEEFDPRQAREVRASYYAKISHIDHWVGRLLDTLEETGRREDTFVVYTSDHGELAGDHERFAKHCFLEQSVRVPFLVSRPGTYPEGETSEALAQLVDLYPTVLDAAGVDARDSLGHSLCPAARNPDDETASGRDAAVSMFEGRTMYLTREYKYAVDEDGDGYLLFDREEDPDEQRNLIGHPEYEDVERALRDELLEFYQDTTYRFRRSGDSFRVYE